MFARLGRDDALGFAGAVCRRKLERVAGGRAVHGALAVTGPAADDDESGQACAFATLTCDLYHTAGRCGMGRAFGLKRLKFLAVRGSGELAVADLEGLTRAREDILRLIAASPALMPTYCAWLDSA